MDILSNALSAVLRAALKCFFVALAVAFMLGLLLLALLSIVFVLLKALLTGRKPAFVTTFQRFQQASQQFQQGRWSGRAEGGFAPPAAQDVVDVQAQEVRHDLRLPRDSGSDQP